MAGTTHVYAGVAGTVGMTHSGTLGGVFRQTVGDNKWQKLGGGLPEDAEVHAITVPPGDTDTVFVGSTKGLFRSSNRGGRFERLAGRRDDDRRHDVGRLLHAIARHRLYRRFNHLAYLCDCVASDLALVDREHIDRNGKYAEGRDFLLADDHVLPDLGDGAWRLGGRHK